MIDTARRVLAGGNWIVDRPKIIDVYPAQDNLANILQETSSNGGSPYNLLLDLAGLQAPFPLEALGLKGEDEADETIFEFATLLMRLGASLGKFVAQGSQGWRDVMKRSPCPPLSLLAFIS
jgi:hypothetical protein